MAVFLRRKKKTDRIFKYNNNTEDDVSQIADNKKSTASIKWMSFSKLTTILKLSMLRKDLFFKKEERRRRLAAKPNSLKS